MQRVARLTLIALILLSTPSIRALEGDDFVKLMNVGKGYLENRSSAKAIEAYEEAVRLRPQSAPAWRNLARAHLLARQSEGALVDLARASSIEADSPATSYLAGLAHTRSSRFAEAVEEFEAAARLDPHTPALRFQLATAYQAIGQSERAIEQLRETVRLDPLHASAHFRLASHARKAGDKAEFERRHREFMRLRKLFGDEARSAEALEICLYTKPEPATIEQIRKRFAPSPSGIEVAFVDVSQAVFATDPDRSATAAAVTEVDKAGRCILFVVEAEGKLSLLHMSAAGTFERTEVEYRCQAAKADAIQADKNVPAPVPPGDHLTGTFDACVVGDFHNDVPEGARYDPKVHAHNDVLLLGREGVRLLKWTRPASFEDVTFSAGLTKVTARRAEWVDYEHDGDLDLVLAGKGGVELWQNNGDQTFTNVTAVAGLEETGPAYDVVAVDLDTNVAVDLVAARGSNPTLVYENQRVGRFAQMPEPPGPWPVARRVLVNDLDNNGFPDAVLIADKEAIIIYGQTAWRARIDLSRINVSDAILLDYDNDGWVDILAVGTDAEQADRGMVSLWRNAGIGKWVNAAGATGLASVNIPPVANVVVGDMDGDGDSDLVLLTADRHLRMLRNDGGQVNGQLKIRLTSIKTNPSGFGTHVELRAGDFWVTRSVTLLPIEIGLGGNRRLDTVQTIWTNGVVDNQIEVTAGTSPLSLVEKNVATGSCPFLYAWDGQGFRFVTDVLGNAPVGLSIRRGVTLPADPDEIVLIGDLDAFPPRDGAHVVEVTEEFREVLYLDQAKLIAIDHPGGVEVHATDKLMSSPFPSSQVWALGSRSRLLRADGDDGIDRTTAMREIDGQFALPGLVLPPPYSGMCHPLSLTLDFGLLDASRPWVLVLTGWLQYGDASANIAISQNAELTVVPPMLEAQIAPGLWTRLDVVVGMPAGKTKTILLDLAGKLPAGTRRLRLTTTFEIRWDRIALFERLPDGVIEQHEALPRSATLYERGFSEIKSRGPGHPTTPDYATMLLAPPWRTTLEGWCTRYGDVLELVNGRDDALAIINAGDALRLEFDAGAFPPVPDGTVRTFFFSSFGLEKDADYNVVDGDTVLPLPIGDGDSQATDDESDWRMRYNTRWVPRDQFAPGR